MSRLAFELGFDLIIEGFRVALGNGMTKRRTFHDKGAKAGIKPSRPGIVAVAARAGVSHITVSRVINGHLNVSTATRTRVLDALKDLGYRPNTAARALVTGRSSTIGVICHNTTLYGPSAALLGLERAAGESGFFVSFVGLASLDRNAVEDAVHRLRQQAVAGIVVVAPQAAMADAFRQVSVEIPTVAIWGHAGTSIPTITASEAIGAKMATEHLLDLGHRNIAHLAGPKDRVSTQDRQRGWRDALAERKIRPQKMVHGNWSAQSGYDAGRQLLVDGTITAVFVANDQMALGMLRAIHEVGRSVPDDISVVGFDDIPDAAYFSPPLTTIRQNFELLGERAFHQLRESIEGRTVSESLILPVELVVRASSASPRG